MKIAKAKLYKQLSTESRGLKKFFNVFIMGGRTCVPKLRCGGQRTMFKGSLLPWCGS